MAAKSSPPRQQKHLAVLIDVDKALAAIVDSLFEKIVNIKRIYGESNAHSQD